MIAAGTTAADVVDFFMALLSFSLDSTPRAYRLKASNAYLTFSTAVGTSPYIFGAICPAKGKGAGLVMPWCDTDAMAAHLIEISAAVDPGAHAVLIVDQAGWHLTPKLAIPDNITVLALPPRSPELNPVENVWQFMRDNWLSNRIFKSYEDIVALCCQAWNNLIDQPWKIMSLGMRKWAHGF